MTDRNRFPRFLAIRRGLIVITAAVSLGSPAAGQSGGAWQCAAESGHFAENPLPLSDEVRSLGGRILFERGLPDERWDPVAKIGFSSNGPSSHCNCAGVLARVHRSQPDIVTFYVVADGQEIGFAQAPLGRPITFHLSISASGMLTASVGKTTPSVKTVRLRNPHHDTLLMSCSSGVVTFQDLQAG
jgi:hypothetical protein